MKTRKRRLLEIVWYKKTNYMGFETLFLASDTAIRTHFPNREKDFEKEMDRDPQLSLFVIKYKRGVSIDKILEDMKQIINDDDADSYYVIVRVRPNIIVMTNDIYVPEEENILAAIGFHSDYSIHAVIGFFKTYNNL